MARKKAKKIDKASKINSKCSKKFKFKKWPFYFSAIFLFLIIFPGSLFAYDQVFSQKIYPGVKVGHLNLGGKTKSQALEIIRSEIQKINNNGLEFVYQNKKTTVGPLLISPTDPDLTREILTFNAEGMVEEAFAAGRNKNFFNNFKDKISFLFTKQKLNARYNLNQDELKKILQENFKQFEKPATNAKLEITSLENEKSSDYQLEIIPEEEGQIFNYDLAIKQTSDNLSLLKNEPIALSFTEDQPKIKKVEASNLLNPAQKILNLESILVKEGKNSWEINNEQIKDWLEFQYQEADGAVSLGLNKDLTKKFLQSIAEEINIETRDAKFKIENNKVVEFQGSQEGEELDLETSYQNINEGVKKINEETVSLSVTLVTKKTKPQTTTDEVNNLGIKELVGRGESNFAGSPSNRRYNIKVGAETLNGLLIKPDEEFSINQALGEISGATGYLPELVIKGNRTIPEYGGGLCQISTTLFRVALDAGLPITERKSHSYRVVYYEPAGMDATIYNPRPDLKFLNDTGNYLLLQTKIQGDNLIFKLWGASDGRSVVLSQPKIYNFTSPGPTKIIETEDLEPGVKKCTERAHAGADAEFSRTITFTDGEIKTETWKSHYVPWSAVCLVGKEPGEDEGAGEEGEGEEGEGESETSSETTDENQNTNSIPPDTNTNIN